MKINKVKIEESDLIARYLPANYTDSFGCLYKPSRKISADDIMVSFWTKSPKWVNSLFKLRDWIVRPFGIQPGNDRDDHLFEDAIRNKGRYKFFEVVAKSDCETVICGDDKHLKMYFAVKTTAIGEDMQEMSVSTVVHFHNWLGRIYFYVICPFHLFIVPGMVKYSLKNLLSSTQKG